ncbi:MAG: TIGR03767 family metallophosphoesterase [Chloroflexi bacterium]|nr:TIGR03767 family metallophosphoesterase [Chloroflexota bacterium]
MELTRRRLTRRRLLSGGVTLSAGLALSLACRGGGKQSLPTTLLRTIVFEPDGVTLTQGPGEPYQVRTDLAEAQVGREKRRRSFLVFHHLTDAQVVDEESPLRSEWFDSCPVPVIPTAFRPHEAMSLHLANSAIRQANRITESPVTGRAVDLAVHTGDAIDNAQINELRWFIALMDGGEVNPDSGGPGYEGVQEESPSADFPDLVEEAQKPFQATGIRYPWYSVVGNDDVLVQGNFVPDEASRAIALGGEKVVDLAPALKEEVCSDPSALLDPDYADQVLSDPKTQVARVTPDLGRRLVSRREWIRQHFNTKAIPGPLGHGFTEANLKEGSAYYVFEHGPISFVGLDTTSRGGFSAGSIDRDQFEWLEEELVWRSRRYFDAKGREVTGKNEPRLIVVLSHHTLSSLNNPFLNLKRRRPPALAEEFEALLHRFRNVVLHIAGHSHQNRVLARADPSKRTPGYWEVNTSSQLDFPMQSRLVEVVDNGDTTLSIFCTVYDLAAPLDPAQAKDPTPADGVNEEQLASMARRVAAADPQLNLEAGGLAASDRNVELILPAPFDLSNLNPPPPHRELIGQEARRYHRKELLTLGLGALAKLTGVASQT